MRQLHNEHDFAEMLAQEKAALFVFVDWSEYARFGREIFRMVEAQFAADATDRSLSWWIVDLSSADSPPNPALHRWVKSEEQKGRTRLLPGIAMGNGPVVWMKHGEVVGFEPSTRRLGPKALSRRTEEILAAS